MELAEQCGEILELHDRKIRNETVDKMAEAIKTHFGCLGWLDETSFEEFDRFIEEMRKR